jgi:hypothetical protein
MDILSGLSPSHQECPPKRDESKENGEGAEEGGGGIGALARSRRSRPWPQARPVLRSDGSGWRSSSRRTDQSTRRRSPPACNRPSRSWSASVDVSERPRHVAIWPRKTAIRLAARCVSERRSRMATSSRNCSRRSSREASTRGSGRISNHSDCTIPRTVSRATYLHGGAGGPAAPAASQNVAPSTGVAAG